MESLADHVTALVARHRPPLPGLGTVLAELRRRGRALTPGSLLRLLDGPECGLRVLRPWRGRLGPLAPTDAGAAPVGPRPGDVAPATAASRRPGGSAGVGPGGRGRRTAGRRSHLSLVRHAPPAGRPLRAPVAPQGAHDDVLVVAAPPASHDPLRGWERVSRAVVALAHDLDEDSLLDRARWLRLQVEARHLAA